MQQRLQHLRIIAVLAFFAAVSVASASEVQKRAQRPQLLENQKNGFLFAILFAEQPQPETLSIRDTADLREQAGRPLPRKINRATTSCSVC